VARRSRKYRARHVDATAPVGESVNDRRGCPIDARGDIARIMQPSAVLLAAYDAIPASGLKDRADATTIM
jgi:hypothetical protein